MDERPAICPWCRKRKRRGSREELVEAVNRCQHDLLAVMNYLDGQSKPSREELNKRVMETLSILGDL